MRGFITAFARNTVFANIVLSIIFFGGLLGAFQMNRETFPDLRLDVVSVAVPWPGADPEEVEEGICIKIEEAIEGIEGIKRYNTESRENVGVAFVEVEEDYDIDEVKDRVENAVNGISTFPKDVEKPVTEKVVFRIAVMFLALAGEKMDERLLKEHAEEIKEELQAIPSISQVEVMGAREYEISIELSEEKLRKYGITFDQVAKAVQANSINLSGGTMRTRAEEIRLRTIGRKYTGEEFSRIVVFAAPQGQSVTLGQVADVRDAFSDDYVIRRFNGKPTATIGVYKTMEEDALEIDEAVLEYVERKQQQLPPTVKLEPWGRMADLLQARIRLLLRNGLIGLALVFLLLWLFLDIRLSFWAGMGMPVSTMGALIVMWYMGATINMISLFGLIMVLGIIVDDAIVVGEAIYVARKGGAPPLKAAVDGVIEVGMPVIAAVLTTVIAFVPLYFVGGFMGKLIAILPTVVIAALLISLVECLFLLPAHLGHLPDPNRPVEASRWSFGVRFHRFMNRGLERFAERVYQPFMARAIRWRYISLSVMAMVGIATMGLVNSGMVEFVFFPEMDGNAVSATIEFPVGTPMEVTEEGAMRIEEGMRRLEAKVNTLSGEPLINNMFAVVGALINDRGGTEVGTHLSTVRVELLETGRRGIYFKDIIEGWREEIGHIPGAETLTFAGDEIAPPGAPIEVWMQGKDMERLLAASGELKKKLGTFDGVYQIQHDFRRGKNEIRLELKPEARNLGLTVADLAMQIHAGYFGQEAVRIQRGRDDVRVRVRYPQEDRKQLAEFQRIRIRTPHGFEVPLMSVAEADYTPGYATIHRTDGMRRVKVTAEVNLAKANPTRIINELERDYFPQLRRSYPEVSMSFQGEQQQTRESLESLMIGFPMAVLGIYIIIATVFRSYIQPIVILVTVPFGTIGAVLGHLAMGFDLSMMSLFGITALAGIVVNDAIVLIECVNSFVAQGEPFYRAVRLGGSRRFRAIFLTTISTVGGLMPLILEDDFQAQMLIPMAISIAAGVAFATLLTLLMVPCLLCILNDARLLVHRIRHGVWVRPEVVEPARWRNADLTGGGTEAPEAQPEAAK